MQHLDVKWQNLVVILPTGRAPKTIFRFFSITVEKGRSEKKSRSKFLKGKFLSFYKALVEKI